jgi:L-ascorbate metabolism protein UlaG (beta-lactamase superfamily)
MPIGAYSPSWPDIHMNPEEAVTAHLDLGGGLLLPVHWATFNLAFHRWSEPVERLLTAAKTHDVRLALPRPGDRVDTAGVKTDDRWWEPAG